MLKTMTNVPARAPCKVYYSPVMFIMIYTSKLTIFKYFKTAYNFRESYISLLRLEFQPYNDHKYV